MAIVPFKLWEDIKSWKEEQIQKPRLPPDPNVSATASLQRDLSSVMANEDLSEAEKSQLYGQTLHKFKTAHQKALKGTSLFPQTKTHHQKNSKSYSCFCQVCKDFECQKTYQRPFFLSDTYICHQKTYKRRVFFSMGQLQ